MKHFLNRFAIGLIGLFIGSSICNYSYSAEPQAEARGIPVVQAEPVSQNSGLGRILGKTINMVSHTGSSLFPKSFTSDDKGAPEDKPMGIFDPRRSESPIRTARLFKIQINQPVAEPTNTVAIPVN